MIFDTLDNRGLYAAISPYLAKGLDFLAQTDFSTLEDGTYEIDGDNVFANVMHYDTRQSNPTPESHVKYIDVQFVIEGEERIDVLPLKDTTGVASQPGEDCWLNYGTGDGLVIKGDRFLAVWPQDAHAPGIAPSGRPARQRKCVVKVRVD